MDASVLGMLFMKRLFLVLTSAACWLGCSSEQPGPGAEQDKFKTETQFCAEWAEVACNNMVVLACDATSRDHCLDSQQDFCGAIVPSGYKSTHAQDCLDAVADAYEDAVLDAEELDIVLRLGGECERLVDGGRDEGDACTELTDCDGVNGYDCVVKPGADSGTCQLPVEAAGGDPCDDPEVVCADGYYCDGENCLRRHEEADTCTSDGVCAAELRCEIATDSTEGLCEARLTNGDVCIANEECVSGICIGTTDKECASRVELTAESTLCDTLK
jgi:hypothetical protein